MPARIDILFAKFIDGTCSVAEYDELMNLLLTNQHEEKVRQLLRQVYQSAARSLKSETYVNDQGSLETAPAEVPIPAPASVHPLRRQRTWLVAAACFVLAIGGAWWFFTRNNSVRPAVVAQGVTKATQRGELKYLLLPDGTQVWLNVASTLAFPEKFDAAVREVSLSGEAYFDVKHAAERPFIIHTGAVKTTVLGTAFNIKAYPGQPDIVVSVKRGKVRVAKNDEVVATLTVGQEVKVLLQAKEEKNEVAKLNDTRVGEWTAGKLSYTSLPLTAILEDLERNYNVEIELTDPELAKETFTTSFRRDIGVEEALEVMRKATNTVLTKKNNTYILSTK